MTEAVQPIDATDVIAFVLALATLFYASQAWRARGSERGMAWFAAGMGCMAAWAATVDTHRLSGSALQWSPWQVVLCAGLAGLALGLVDYVGVPPRWRWRAQAAMLLPTLVFGALVAWIALSGALVPRALGQLPVALAFLAMGLLAAWAARREPGAGHGVMAVALLALPAIAVAIAVLGAQGVSLRLFAFGPLLAMALTLVPASLQRSSRALRAESERRGAIEAELRSLNRRLEAAVAQRTADLQGLVVGLESFNRDLSQGLHGSLHGIAGLARRAEQALLRGDSTPALHNLPAIASQARQSVQTLASLLLLAQMGDAPLQPAPVNLQALTQAVLDELGPLHGAQALARIEVAADLPQVQGDSALLKPVLASLIGNALKFTQGVPAGRVQVGAAANAGAVEVFVRDNGVGFDTRAAGHLFTPFQRLHDPTYEGAGLGLSIARRGVERHGGRIWAESRPGHGAEFRFSLPG